MSFDLEQTLKDMLEAAKAVFAAEWPRVKDDMKRVLNDQKEALAKIAEACRSDAINDQEFEEQLEDEKEAFEAGLSMARASAKATTQRAIDAAMAVFRNAVKAAT